ncbi:hypothetical protein OSSY52_03200 [Tepiditoga spiralis]|uniref:Glycosyltransferase RgtA/B/C/D-like domain-containing protein n=1 Tax=Tepiditoga spiralis TaxID=2108365 RepID=A0A7G1G9Z6_9BACT|nr:hypothetical protein [Tepiditoga spiralis]BBE30179.1 hypothetical protein OSSY52_03200 [Tepiditoga spiralis]
MFGILLITLSFIVSIKYNKLNHFILFNLLIVIMIYLMNINSYEALFQIAFKTSDTKLYFSTFNLPFEDMTNKTFYQYPMFLRYLIYPFKDAVLALITQSNIIFLLLILIFKDLNNIFFFTIYFNHTLFFTNINFLKDNYLIIVILLTIFLIQNIKNKIMQAIIIAFSILIMKDIRPFYKFFIFLSIIPFVHLKQNSKKKNFIIIGLMLSLAGLIFLLNFKYIMAVLSTWNATSSTGTTGFSILSPIKIIFGPTPLRYLYSQNFFVQPFLKEHNIIFFVLHLIYYLILPYLIIMFFINIKEYLNISALKSESLYSLGMSLGTFLVYLLIYGSADIRQRAIILLFLTIFIIKENTLSFDFILKYKYSYFFIFLFEMILMVISV